LIKNKGEYVGRYEIIRYANGNKWEGLVQDGKYIRYGTYTFSDGSWYKGIIEYDEL